MRLEWAESAEADLLQIAEYYGELDPDLPDRFFDRIVTAPLILLEQLRLGAPAFGKLRKWPIRRTPFILLYRVIGDLIEVARVVHAASDWNPFE